MPIIAQIMIPIRFGDGEIIEILKEDIYDCGCIDLAAESKKLHTPIEHLVAVIRSMDDVRCNEEGICCVVSGFAEKLKKFRGE